MNRVILMVFVIILILSILLAIAIYLPIPVTPYLDFQVLYRANRAILNGIPLYDREAQTEWIAQVSGVSVDEVFVLPFPYPPWYAVSTLPLAFLPLHAAARMWFLLNISMLLLSVWLFTDGWHPRKRLISFLAALSFLPILGALIVGQYVFPAILGMALIVYSVKREHAGLLALGMALVTFKPHIGIFVLLAILLHLIQRRDAFGRRAFWWTSAAGVFLFLLGFTVDKMWLLNYFRSLSDFRNISECEICTSLPLVIGRIAGLGYDQSAPIAGAVLTVAIALFIGSKHRLGSEASSAFFACVPLLVNPYLLNYDFSFALIPLFYLSASAGSKLDWLWIASFILLPWVGLLIFNRAGNPVLLFCTLAMTSIILTRKDKGHTIVS